MLFIFHPVLPSTRVMLNTERQRKRKQMKEQLHADSGDVRYQSTQESNASEIQYYLVVKYNRYKTLSTLFSHKMNLYFGLCPD